MSRVGLGGGFVRFASIVGDVKARPLEDQPGPRSHEPIQLLLFALGTLGQRRLFDRLQLIEFVLTSGAAVLVGWHRDNRGRSGKGKFSLL